mmetsp:Transcript_33389/g.50372  ORF Transcript_33389/g.50372 Transcript_33389/m.50372 type:complete len:89 (+) Transcript_33389:455-721(+)
MTRMVTLLRSSNVAVLTLEMPSQTKSNGNFLQYCDIIYFQVNFQNSLFGNVYPLFALKSSTSVFLEVASTPFILALAREKHGQRIFFC